MQELNHDMEDLFRRAAESYPLNQTGNWKTVAKKLDVSLPQRVQRTRKENKKRWLVLLLFLFLVAGGYFAIDRIPADGNRKYSVDKKSAIDSRQPIEEGSTVDSPQSTVSDEISDKQSGAKQYAVTKSDKPQAANLALRNITEKQSLTSGQQKTTYPTPGVNEQSTPEPLRFLYYSYSSNPITVLRGGAQIDSLNGIYVKRMPNLLKQVHIKSKPKFYFGIKGGLAANSVKSFGYSKSFEGGLFAGVQFTNRFSAEASLLYTLNNYEAKSVHFDKNGIAGMLTGGRELNEVHGSNKLVEIPLRLRYKFSPRSKSFYAGAGLSSYIMTRETNWYLTTLNGTNEMLYGDYDKKNIYLASALNLFTGYELPTGQKNSLLLEPYVILPLRGIGVGNIRLMSIGLHVGYSRTSR